MKDIKSSAKNKESDIDQLSINEDYAKRFQYNKKRQILEKAKAKYGTDFARNEDDFSSSSSNVSEDSEGELDNEIVRDKFIDTLLKLKDEKQAKTVITTKEPIFKNEDFNHKRPKEFKANECKVAFSITDALINVKEDDEIDEDNIYSVNYKPKKIQQSQEEKKAFIDKANEEIVDLNKNDTNDKDFFDDGLLIQKPKKHSILVDNNDKGNEMDSNEKGNQTADLLDENNREKEKGKGNIGVMTLTEALNKCKVKPKNVNMKLLEKIWGDEANLSNQDLFLRNYILSEAWIERDRSIMNKNLLMVDKIDEENDELFDDFENKYNHRFEEENGANITTYQRNLDTYRQKDDARIKKRKEHEKRKEEEKKRLKEEMKQAKEAQAEELKNKLEKIEKIAGTEKIIQLANEFNDDKDFDMRKFDQKMNEIFNEDYYNQQDEEMLQKDEEVEQQEETKDNDNNQANTQINAIDEEIYNDGYEDDLWFYCDNCKKVIKETKIVYECKTCSDYSLCKECFKANGHNHQMKKSKVPFGCKPPSNYKEIIEIVETDETMNKCSNCNAEIIASYYFICSEDSGCSQVKICKTCRGIGKSIHEHKLSKFYYLKDNEEADLEQHDLSNLNPKEKLKAAIDSKTDMVIDDVIAKEIPSKFHYAKVSKDTSDLSNEMLLFLDDKSLNKYIPLKKIAPYSDFSLPEYKKKQMRKHFEKLIDKKKKEMLNEYTNQATQEKKNEKMFIGKKTSYSKGDFITNKDEYKKKKRLETYGIED